MVRRVTGPLTIGKPVPAESWGKAPPGNRKDILQAAETGRRKFVSVAPRKPSPPADLLVVCYIACDRSLDALIAMINLMGMKLMVDHIQGRYILKQMKWTGTRAQWEERSVSVSFHEFGKLVETHGDDLQRRFEALWR